MVYICFGSVFLCEIGGGVGGRCCLHHGWRKTGDIGQEGGGGGQEPLETTIGSRVIQWGWRWGERSRVANKSQQFFYV